jgi:uridine kinase
MMTLAKKTIIIGISGASASGKSLLANTIVNELGSDQVVVISEDSYYKDHANIPFE